IYIRSPELDLAVASPCRILLPLARPMARTQPVKIFAAIRKEWFAGTLPQLLLRLLSPQWPRARSIRRPRCKKFRLVWSGQVRGGGYEPKGTGLTLCPFSLVHGELLRFWFELL